LRNRFTPRHRRNLDHRAHLHLGPFHHDRLGLRGETRASDEQRPQPRQNTN
jgi:hypothetical protein